MAPKKPWTSAKMTAARLEALKKGIVGFSMRVEDVEGSFKLNQQKSEADYAAVANGLAALPDQGSHTIAQLMRETRPQAEPNESNQRHVRSRQVAVSPPWWVHRVGSAPHDGAGNPRISLSQPKERTITARRRASVAL